MKNIRLELKKILIKITNNKNSVYSLLNYFDEIYSKQDLLIHYSFSPSENYDDNNSLIKFFENIENSFYRDKAYQIIFYANNNFLYEVFKEKFRNKIEFYENMEKIYKIDLIFMVKLEIKKIKRTDYDKSYNFLQKNYLLETLGFEKLLENINEIESKLLILSYFFKQNNKKSTEIKKLFQETFKEYLEKLLIKSCNTLSNKELYNYIINREDSEFKELYELSEKIYDNFNKNIIKSIVNAFYDEFKEIKNLTKILMIKDHKNEKYGKNKLFLSFEFYLEKVSAEKKIDFYVDYYKKLGASDVYLLNFFLRDTLTEYRKNWIIKFIDKNYNPFDHDNEKILTLLNKLNYNQKLNLFNIYPKLKQNIEINPCVNKLKRIYKNHLQNRLNIDLEEIEKVFDYFDNKISLDKLKKQSIDKNSYRKFCSISNKLFYELKENEFEYLKKYIEYENVKLGKSLFNILNEDEFYEAFINKNLEILDIYNFTKDQILEIRFDSYINNSWGTLEDFSSDDLFCLIEKRIGKFSPKKKYNFFNSFMKDIRFYELCFDNIGSNKELKKLLINKSNNFDEKSIIQILEEKLQENLIKYRENAIDILNELDFKDKKDILETHLKFEKSKKLKEKIKVFIKDKDSNKTESNKNLEEYLALLTTANKKRLEKLGDIFISLKNIKNSELSIEYSMLLVSLYINYDFDKAKEIIEELEFLIDIKSIKQLAKHLYNWFKLNNFDNKYREIAYFSVANSSNETIKEIKKDIENLATKNVRGQMAANILSAFSYNEDKIILLYLDYIIKKIKDKRVIKVAKENLKRILKLKNMTLEHAKDILIPNFGFDLHGERVFSYGSREFIVKIIESGRLQVLDMTRNKVLRNLPKPSKTDDKLISEKSYEEFKLLKKQVKDNYNIQLQRIIKSMIIARRWSKELFINIFVKNSVVREFSVCLIWGIYDEKNILQNTFRVLGDGTFTQNNDEEFFIEENSKIGIIHLLELSKEETQKWKKHLKEHEVNQSFDQLDRTVIIEKTDYSLLNLNTQRPKKRLLSMDWDYSGHLDYGTYYLYYYKSEELNIVTEFKYEAIYMGEYERYQVKNEIKHINFYPLDKIDFEKNYKKGLPEKLKLNFKDIPKHFYSEIMLQINTLIDHKERIL